MNPEGADLASVQRRLGRLLATVRAVERELREVEDALRSLSGSAVWPGGRDRERLRGYLVAMVAQILADEVEPLVEHLERAATRRAGDLPEVPPS
jgi:hypothetical protein